MRQWKGGMVGLWVLTMAGLLSAPQVRAEAKGPPMEPSNPCLGGVLKELAFRHDAAFRDDGEPLDRRLQVCSPLLDSPGTAAVAFLVPSGEDSDEINLDLHLYIVDDEGKPLAKAFEKNAASDEPMRLGDLKIDTSQYRLAPGKIAFDLRIYNYAPCYQCVYTSTITRVYLREGGTLRQLLSLETRATRESEGAEPDCIEPFIRTERALTVGKRRYHGLADLIVTTLISHVPGYLSNYAREDDAGHDIDTIEECSDSIPDERSSEMLRYDGRQYRPVRGSKHDATLSAVPP